MDQNTSTSNYKINIFESNGDCNLNVQHVLVNNIKVPSATHIKNCGDTFLVCAKTPRVIRQSAVKKLLFLQRHRVLGTTGDTFWGLKDCELRLFNDSGECIFMKMLKEEHASTVTSSFITSNCIYLCCEESLVYLRHKAKGETFIRVIPGNFEKIFISKYSDVLTYGGGHCFVSLSTPHPNTSKQTFEYDMDAFIEMAWLDVAIVQLYKTTISVLDNCGHVLHMYVLPGGSCFMSIVCGNGWVAALTDVGTILVFDSELVVQYSIISKDSSPLATSISAGNAQLCVLDNQGNVLVIRASPNTKFFRWTREISDFSKGLSDSLRFSLQLDISVIQEQLLKAIPRWLDNDPTFASCQEIEKLTRRSIEVTRSIIYSLHDWVKDRIDSTSRKMWAHVFRVIKIVLRNGMPDMIRSLIQENKNIYAVAEAAEIFGVEVFGNSEVLTWAIVNQQQSMYRELIYKFLDSPQFASTMIEVLARTCSTLSVDSVSISNNPFYLLSAKHVIDSCKNGNVGDWLRIFELYSPHETSRHIQKIFDNVSEFLVFKNSLALMVQCLLLAKPPSKLTLAPTIKYSMLRCVVEMLPEQHASITPEKIPLVLSLLSFDSLQLEGRSFSNKKCVASTINSSGIYIGTEQGVYTLPYIGLYGNMRRIMSLKVSALASSSEKLAIAGRKHDINVLYMLNSETGYILFSYETESLVDDMNFFDGVLMTIERSGTISVYNETTGRIEQLLRTEGRDNSDTTPLDDSSDDEDESVRVHPQNPGSVSPGPPPPPPPPALSTTTLIPPRLTRLPPPPPLRPRRIFSEMGSSGRLIEMRGHRTFVWQKHGLTFNVRMFVRPNNWLTLSVSDHDEKDREYDVFLYISQFGDIRVSNMTSTFFSKRREMVLAAEIYGSKFVIIGTVKGTVVLFDFVCMCEIATVKLPGNPAIHDFSVDGCELYVCTDKGVFVLFVVPWNQETVLHALLETSSNSEAWSKAIKKFPFKFDKIMPTIQFVHFIDMCTRGEKRISDTWRHKNVISALMKMNRRTEALSTACVQRIIDSVSKREAPFQCAICQSSSVNESDAKKLYIIKPCLHRFHNECIHRLIEALPDVNDFTMHNWALETRLQCPICRTQFTPSDVAYDPISTKHCLYTSSNEECA